MLALARTLSRGGLVRRTASLLGKRGRATFSGVATSGDDESSSPGKSPNFMIVVNNEDFRVETAALNKMSVEQPGQVRMLAVVGGGDTTLASLIHQHVGHITAVDMAPNQVHLLQLKLATAISDATTTEAADFLVQGDRSSAIFDKKIAHLLPEESLEFFHNDGQADIAYGPLRRDNDNIFNVLLRQYLESEHGLHLVQFDSLEQTDRQRLLDICNSEQAHDALTELLLPVFKGAPWFQAMPEDMQEYLLGVIDFAAEMNMVGLARVLRDRDLGIFPFNEFHTDVVMTGQMKTLPPWLTDNGREILRSKAHLLETQCARLEELEIEDANFDLMTLSNCYDFVHAEQAADSVQTLASNFLRENGQILIRKGAGGADEVLNLAGARVSEGDNLELHDHTQLFYQHRGSVALGTFP